MKLIDAVVEKYPIGTWPAGMLAVGPMYTFNAFVGRKIKDDEYVTREQYEAALAASKSEWDGEGLPPAGCVCEVRVCDGFEKCEIVFSHPKSGVAFVYLDEENHGGKRPVDCISPIPAPMYFRPIRSDADKKRDDAIAEMVKRIGITPESAATCYEICIRID